ncbi:MAG: hypothetical protein IJL66_02785 [Lachnospiraceae bacterium]|nr:hypothetical protein [Lachnospiraceae bacterium]
MNALLVKSVKPFTAQLFLRETFDRFLLQEAVFVTDFTTTLDGRVIREGLSEEELKALPDPFLLPWSRIRPLAFQVIKGDKLPRSFHIVLGLARPQIEALLRKDGVDFPAEQVGGLFLNIRYEDARLTLITGTALTAFTLDKSVENLWDKSVRAFLAQKEIDFDEAL